MKKSLLLVLMLILSASTFAVEVEIDGLWYEVVSKAKEAKVIQYKNDIRYNGDIVIPESVEYEDTNYSVTSIGECAFYWCRGLTSVTIPKSVTSIGSSAFYDCYGLTSVNITDIEAWCKIYFSVGSNPLVYAHHLFLNGEEIKDLTIPNSVTSIGECVFSGCSGLTSIEIPNSVTSIGDEAFSACNGLTSIEIPNSVTSIGKYAFSGCDGLTTVEIPNSVTSIGEYAFSACYGLTSIEIPNSVTNIGDGLFSYCDDLTSVTIPSSVTYIGKDAFRNCYDLTSIEIPNSVTSIGRYAFGGCSSLTSFDIPNNVIYIGECAFSGCSGLTSVTIPNSMTSIGDYTFYECSSLTSIKIPNNVTDIGEGAFEGCTALTTVTIGNGVTSIGSKAFAKCDELMDVYCYAQKISIIDVWGNEVPITEKDAFINSYTDYVTLHVPAGSVAAYSEVEPWKNFKEIVAIEETGETYTLIYKVDGEEYKTCSLKEGEAITPEDDPTKDGYEFSGWSEIPKYMPASDLTIIGSFDLIADYDEITIGSNGKGTFSSKYDLNFADVEGLKAYTATGYESEENTVWLSRVLRVPAGTGLMVKGEAGTTYKVPHTISLSCYANYFKANTGGQISIGETEDEWTNYYLSGGQFKKVNGSANIGHKKCYLQLPSRFFSKTRSIEIVYDDEGTTGIMDHGKKIMDKASDEWYTLSGQRVSQPTKKGLYIHNGKKVVIR